MIPRTLFDDDHEMFRDSVRRFAEQEIIPHLEQWDHEGVMEGLREFVRVLRRAGHQPKAKNDAPR